MTLTPQWLDELRARVSLSGLIGRTVRVQKAGREFKACCPFHNEKTPSFTINDEKGFYHCFGCGAHGDAIRWMTDQRGLAFMDAVKELAAEAGMEVPAPDPRAAKQAEKRDSLHDVMQAAQDWFVASLAGPQGEKARAYLASRGFNDRTIERFGFGYSPEDRQAMKKALGERFGEDMLVEAGLRIVVEEKETYDRFRGRLMLPIQDARGRVIAFGGRILDGAHKDAPKYLNSPDTPLFDKGRTLYNLNRAGPAARQSGRLVVVEGYMDVIALSAAGIEEAVAPMGTALTEQQIELLWRTVETPVLCFDGDAAGQRAAMRAVSRALPLLRPAHSLRIVTLPEGLDPDDLIKREGPQAMERLLNDALPLIDVLWAHERDAAPLATPEDKAGLKARLMALVETIGDPDIKALYRRELSERFSEFAYPRRAFEPRASSGRRTFVKPALPSVSPENITRLRRVTGGGGRDALISAIIGGLLLHPCAIAANAPSLEVLATEDRRFEILLDQLERGQALETTVLETIFRNEGLTVPAENETKMLRFPFLASGTDQAAALASLRDAIEILVEGPRVDAALKLALSRYENELSAESEAEYGRLRTRKLEFEARLRQMREFGGSAGGTQIKAE